VKEIIATDPNDYSVELISQALVEAARAGASSVDDGEIIAAYLNYLVKILGMNCAIFYSAENSPLPVRTALRIHSASKRELAAPVSVTRQAQAFVLNSVHQVVTSEDALFSMGHLTHLVLPNSASSLWVAIAAREIHFGTVVLLDESPRHFLQIELDVARAFALQLGHTLLALNTSQHTVEADESSSDLARHFENAKLMNVVSRDLINPLTAMLGYLELLKAEPLDEKPMHYLERLAGQVEKIQNIVLSLSAPAPQPMPPSAPLPAMVVALQPKFPPGPMSMPVEIPQPMTVAGGNRPRILLVQKNEALIEFQRSVLSGMMVDPVISLTGLDAMTFLQSEDVQAVILDDELDGEWPGRKLLSWIMANKPELSERILLTVSTRPKADIRELIEKSNIAYISKPLQMGALLTGVQQILGYSPAVENKFLH
jgi:CheY-like chemotaxis protein